MLRSNVTVNVISCSVSYKWLAGVEVKRLCLVAFANGWIIKGEFMFWLSTALFTFVQATDTFISSLHVKWDQTLFHLP